MDKKEKLLQIDSFIRWGTRKCFLECLDDYKAFEEKVKASFINPHHYVWYIEPPPMYPCIICPEYRFSDRWQQQCVYAEYIYLSDFGIETPENI